MRNKWRLFVCAWLLAAASPALADIWSFTDENGRAHFSDVRLDDRYQLYMKDRPKAEVTRDGSRVEVTFSASKLPELREPPAATLADVRQVPAKLRKEYAQMISKVAKEQKVDPALIHAVVTVESFYNPRAVSPKGATGLMQLMPDTAKQYGTTDLLNPLQNLRAGAKYLRALLSKFGHDIELALAAYNAGEGSVMRSGNKIPPYPETRAYVPKVLEYYERYRASSRI